VNSLRLPNYYHGFGPASLPGWENYERPTRDGQEYPSTNSRRFMTFRISRLDFGRRFRYYG
jgi:hypothetical protein